MTESEDPKATKPLHKATTIPVDPQATYALARESRLGGPRFPIADWDRFVPMAFLGEGGMGRVYKARDPRLNRLVALKFIRGEDSELLGRFQQEAKNQALIEHPNVCKVYEVGEEQGQSYIAMQFIDGLSLDKARAKMSLEEKVLAMLDVAEAIHAAHRQGIIHRDLKPANIMLEKTEQGRWWPYVMDFGLARGGEGMGMTMSGVAMGTPAYMPPEQALGRINEIDRRSDVYSLGATLYELLTDFPPFEGESLTELLMKVVRDDPPSLRKRISSIPPDLETIVQKCLEKEPHRRYDSAKALADDLRRFLDGEPIQARPASITYKVRKKLKKNRALSIVIAVSATIAMGFMGWGLRTAIQARQQAQLANRFALEVKAIEETMRVAYMRPMHDLRTEKAKVRARMERISSEMKQLGPVATGPGGHALGLGHMALGESAEARTVLQKAWDSGYRPPQLALSLGQALGAVYDSALRGAQQLPKEDREARAKELERDLLRPAQTLLQKHLSAQEEGRTYLEALLAHFQGQEEEAIRKAQAAFRENPGQYEARRLEAQALMVRALNLRNGGHLEDAKAALENAGRSLKEALELGRSDGSLWRAEADRLAALAQMSAERASLEQVEGLYRRSVDACLQALFADPEDVLAMRRAAETLYDLASFRLDHGADNMSALEGARNWLEKAIALSGQDGELWFWLGRVRYAAARAMDFGGNDSLEAYSKTIEAYRKAQERGRESSERSALVMLFKAQYENRHGTDPRNSLAEALGLVRRAQAMREDRFSLNTLGLVLNASAVQAMQRGEDPRPLLMEAQTCFRKGFERYSSFASLRNLADSWIIQAKYERSSGVDPRLSLDKAQSAIRDALRLGSNYFLSHLSLGEIHLLRARDAVQRGEAPSFEEGRKAFEKAILLNPKDQDAYLRLAELHILRARTGNREALVEAKSILETAGKRCPESAERWTRWAEYHLARGRILGLSLAPEASREGIRAADRALAINARATEAKALKAELLEWSRGAKLRFPNSASALPSGGDSP